MCQLFPFVFILLSQISLALQRMLIGVCVSVSLPEVFKDQQRLHSHAPSEIVNGDAPSAWDVLPAQETSGRSSTLQQPYPTECVASQGVPSTSVLRVNIDPIYGCDGGLLGLEAPSLLHQGIEVGIDIACLFLHICSSWNGLLPSWKH